MKQLFILIAVFCLLPSEWQAQEIASRKSAIKKGDNSINLYYGTNLLSGIYKRVASSAAINMDVKAFGPIGLVYEHMISDIVGLGAELGYAQTSIVYHLEHETYNSATQQYDTDIYNYELKFSTARAMFRANFHFAQEEKFDAYALISAGYRITTFDLKTNDTYNPRLTYRTLFPFGVKPGIGLRYFFNKNIGLHTEIALGTPLMCGGLSFKF